MDYLGVGRFHLVGTAAGGWVSVDYVLSFQQRLRSLVIANSTGGLQDEEYLALLRRLRPPQFDTLPHDFLELGPAYRAADPDGTRRWNELEHLSRPDGQALTPLVMKNRATYSALETVRVPTLFLTGDADLYAPPPLLRLFTARIKDSTSVIVPEAGHSAYWEQPDVFNRSVLEFIRKHSTD
jgi:pimeloyl-ACP methyl ester carboxylesterase